jgi:uncharacterized protein (DUF1684 family)
VLLPLAIATLMTSAIPPDLKHDLDRWRAEKDHELRAPDSPLAYVGRIRFETGHNTLGSGADDRLKYASPGVPEHALDVVAEGSTVELVALLPVVSLNGQPVERAILRGNDAIDVGPLHLVYQGGAAATLYDSSRPEAIAYHGLKYLPVDPHYRVPATFEPAAAGKTLILETTQHDRRELQLRGVLHFKLAGQELSLEGFQLGSNPDLFVIFRDGTSGKESYGAGRFLWVKTPVDSKTTVDFNLAWNPLCAYSDGYNCPLAPPENRLSVRIPVGEAPYHD